MKQNLRSSTLTITITIIWGFFTIGDSFAAGTPADTPIVNTATATFNSGGQTESIASEPVEFRVDELLDLSLTNDDAGRVLASSPGQDQALTYRLTNTGNGSESFVLTADSRLTDDDFDPDFVNIYIDNGDGEYDPSADTLYETGVNDPELVADGSVVLFVLNDIPAALPPADLGLSRLEARALTLSGEVGTTGAALGDGGTDALIGASGARGSAQGVYEIPPVLVGLVKSVVGTRDPDGGDMIVEGSVLTFELILSLDDDGSATGVIVRDPIPPNTNYVPGTLTLDSAVLTDEDDEDVGRIVDDAVEVALGDVSAPAVRTVRFDVRVEQEQGQ